MVTPWLAFWAVAAAQAPDTGARLRHAAALQALNDSIGAVQAAAVAFRVDLGMASSDLVLARARRLHERCAAARRTAQSVAALVAGTPRTAHPPAAPASSARRAAERRARRDLADLERLLQQCERDYDPAEGANPDTLKVWGPFRVTQFESALRLYAQRVQEPPGIQ